MLFKDWAKKQDEEVYWSTVLGYLGSKKDEKAREVEEEVKNAKRCGIRWIPMAVYEDDYYSF